MVLSMPSQGLKILLTTGVLIAAFVGLMWTTIYLGAYGGRIWRIRADEQ